MPIHHFLAVLVVALAVPLQAALATCQCFKETGPEWWYGYLELEPTTCDTTPSGFGWLQVQPDSTGEPNPPMYVALYSSRTFNGCNFLIYNSAWPNGPSKVLLDSVLVLGCESNPPRLVFDFQPPPCGTSTLAALTVTLAGSGSGSVTSTPAGINCTGGNCSASFPLGTLVTLTATRNTGSKFTGWSGAGCTGTGTCTVTMAESSSVTATFDLAGFCPDGVCSGAENVNNCPADCGPCGGKASCFIRPRHSNLCVGISEARMTNGAPLIQWGCYPTNEEKFKFTFLGNSRYKIQPIHSSKCLAIGAASTANGAAAKQWDCLGSAEQQFVVQKNADG